MKSSILPCGARRLAREIAILLIFFLSTADSQDPVPILTPNDTVTTRLNSTPAFSPDDLPSSLMTTVTCDAKVYPNSDHENSATAAMGVYVYYMERVIITCKPGYEASYGSNKAVVMCQPDKTFSDITCSPVTCAPKTYANSDHAGLDQAATGVYMETRNITCDPGYVASDGNTTAWVTCQADRTFTDATCSPVTCTPKTYANSDLAAQAQAATGVYMETRTITCGTGYEVSRGVKTATVTCQADGTFTDATCSPVTCTPKTYANSDHAARAQAATGVYMETRNITCGTGYEVSHGVKTAIVTCQADGTFTDATCSPVTCAAKIYDHSDHATQAQAVIGVYMNTRTITCDSGYEVSPGVDTKVVTCQADGTFTDATCSRGIYPHSVYGFTDYGDFACFQCPGEVTIAAAEQAAAQKGWRCWWSGTCSSWIYKGSLWQPPTTLRCDDPSRQFSAKDIVLQLSNGCQLFD